LFKETGTGADFDGKTAGLAKCEESSEKFVRVDAPQDGLLVPDAAVPEKLLLRLRIDGHCVFRLY